MLSIPVRGYYILNKLPKPFFDKVLAVYIETSTVNVRRKLEFLKLGSDESIVSLNVMSLYKNVPPIEATEIALRSLYSSEHAPEMSRSAFRTILKLAVTNICFKCNDRCFCQVDGLAMGASIAVTLAKIWMKSIEHQNKSTKEIIKTIPKNDHQAFPECNRRVTSRGKGVESEKHENWLHAKWQNFYDQHYTKMKDMV